jgi:ABC-type lipoprotein export system ATPase subunit
MLQLSALSYRLNGKLFFEDLSITFEKGLIHTLSGKNGTGKSTLLRILHGDALPEKGTITIHNKSLALTNATDRAQLKKEIGFVPQAASTVIIPELTVAENLRLAAITHIKLLSALPSYERSLIEQFNIPLDAQAQSLSGGQKHILAIAMVLQQQRSVLLLDEPVATLDDENATLVLSCVETICKKTGIIVIIVTHDPLLITVPVQEWNLIVNKNNVRNLIPKMDKNGLVLRL